MSSWPSGVAETRHGLGQVQPQAWIVRLRGSSVVPWEGRFGYRWVERNEVEREIFAHRHVDRWLAVFGGSRSG